ncbi:MAG: nucleoside monophosphate kinase [Planctomycetes bacterium]|nr:nucleoside monophosphate kinase [Planctomycetota bacterium]
MPKKGDVHHKDHELESQDARLIFKAVWNDLLEEKGKEGLVFPQEIIWLGGAPGSGKGTNTPFILNTRGISAEPIVTSDLLNTPQAQMIKSQGGLVGDREVVSILFKSLLDPIYQNGVVVDGFPRTKIQVKCLKLFFRELQGLRDEFKDTPKSSFFRQPRFSIALLFVTEKESIERQLYRGKQIEKHNKKCKEDNREEDIQELRLTDLDPKAAQKRYKVFKENTFDNLISLKKIFHFRFIDATGPLDEVQKNIESEFQYQSSLELDHDTYDQIKDITLASQIGNFARQELVKRMDSYQEDHPGLFKKIIYLIKDKFMPIISRHALSGLAIINSEDKILSDPLSLPILLDILTERGYHCTVDVNFIDVPDSFDPETYKVKCIHKKIYRFRISFDAADIRRGNH